MGHNSTSPEELEARDRENQAIELRMAGVKWETIAERIWGPGTHARTAQRAVVRALERTAHEPAEHLRGMEVRRLDHMTQAIWPQVNKGNLLAIDRALKVMERRAQLLGLDAPQKRIVEVVTPEAIEEALEAAELEAQELRAQLEAAPAADFELEGIDAEVVGEIEESRRAVVERATTARKELEQGASND